MVTFHCKKVVNYVSTIANAFPNCVSVEIEVNSIERSKSQARIALRIFVFVFLVLFMATPALSENINVSELIDRYGKDDLVTFIREHRDGYFTVEWLSDGKLSDFNEEIDNRYITVKSIKKDLEIIEVTASDVNRQMSQIVPSKKQSREAEETILSGHEEENELIDYRKYKERLEGIGGQQFPDEWIFEKMDRSKFDPATLPPPHEYAIEDLMKESPSANRSYIEEGLNQYYENIRDGKPEPYQRTTALEFQQMGRERIHSEANQEKYRHENEIPVFILLFIFAIGLMLYAKRKKDERIPQEVLQKSWDPVDDDDNGVYEEKLEADTLKKECTEKTTNETQPSQTEKKLFAECASCKKSISARADTCPKCGEEQTKECLMCNNLIPSQASNCPECGDPSPFSAQENKQVEGEYILKQHGDNNVIMSILIAIPCFIFIALFVSAVNDLMDPSLLRLAIILLAFYSTFKSWEWLKNRFS